jgi:hypothetical protein
MRLPGFTAERNLRGVIPSYSAGLSAAGKGAGKRLAVSRPVSTGYTCTPDNRACICSGVWDCLFCTLFGPCGVLNCTCDPWGNCRCGL